MTTQKEMFNDSVQSMEYTITTPMLFATLLAAASPDVPTGMVQWAFGCLTASHMLCIPVLYLSQVLSRKKKEPAKTWLPWSYMTGSILLLLAACALLQVAGLLISCIYLYSTYTHYAAPGSIAPIAGGMVAMQFFFVLAVVTSTLTNLTSSPDSTFCCCMSGENFASMMSWLYIMINLFMKMAIGTSLVVNADDRHFAVWGCKTWDGRYQALEEAQ